MTDDPTTQAHETPEEVDHVTGELVPVAPNRPAWVEQLRPNQTTDGYVPAMPALLRAADLIYQTPFVPKGLRTPGGTLGAMMYGRELGLPPITSLQSLHEINGKVGMSAEMMRARITAAGHEFVIVEATAQRCRIRCRRKEDKLDPEAWRVVEYLYSEAVLAGDDRNKDGRQQGTNYQKRPVDMLVARCTTRAARWHFPEEIHGLSSAEELDDLARSSEFEGPAPTSTAPVARTPRAERVTTRATRAASKPAAPPPTDRPAQASEAPGGPSEAEDIHDAEVVEVEGSAPIDAAGEEPVEFRAPAASGPDVVQELREAVDAAKAKREAAGPPVAAAQRAAIMGHFSRMGLADDRDERLEAISTIIGRRIGSANELTRAEASKLLDGLGKLRDREGLYKVLDGLPTLPPAAEAPATEEEAARDV